MHKDRMRTFLRSVCLVLLLCTRSAIGDDLKAEEIAKPALEATVLLIMYNENDELSAVGSGFFVEKNIIATNFHVIEGAINGIAKRVGQESIYSVEELVNQDEEKDLAILRVAAPDVKPLYLGDSDSVRIGHTIYVAGNPEGLLEGTFSDGIISAIRGDSANQLLQLTAPISEGSSGGPVLNEKGDVIGVSVATWKSGQNLNFAIPSKYLKALMMRSGIRPPQKPKPKSDSAETARRKAERAKTERAKVEAERAKTERVKAEARKAEAEARKAEAEAKIAEAERAKAEAESAKKEKAKVLEPKTRIANQLQAATVLIFGRDRNGNEGLLGSGFFVHKDQVATDFHVVAGSTLKKVKRFGQGTQSSDSLFGAQLLKTDKAHHLAILQVEGADVQPLSLGNSKKVSIGDKIFVITNPSQRQDELSEGTISNDLNNLGVQYFQFTPRVSPGSSGGAIVNSSGEVVAMTALQVPELSGNLNFAVPSNYLTKLLEGEGDTPLPSPSPPTHKVSPDVASLPEPSPYREWLKSGIDHYGQAKYDEAIRLLESALDGLTHPENRAKAHLYLGCARRGRGDSQESIIAEFSEALAYKPCLELPPKVGQNHPVFKPLLEKTREDATGTLTVNASPPQTQIKIVGSHGEIIDEAAGSVNSCRLFKGDYTVTCTLGEATNLKTVRIVPGVHYILDREITRMPSTSRELTLELDRMVKPQRVDVHFEIYGPSGNELNRGVKQMQLQGEKPDLGTWVYHVNWPPSTPAGRLAYRIKVDGEDIIPIPPPEIVILEPPTDAWVYINQAFDLKARVTSDIQLTEVLVHYSDASKKLRKMDTPDTYIGTVTARDKRKAGTIWYFVTAKDQEGKISRSEVRLVEIKRLDDETDTDSVPPPEITVLAPRGSAVLPINEPIEIKAEVKSSAPLKEVRVFYNSERKQLSETSPSSMLENKSSDTYIGKIPKEHNREEGYIWYFVTATTEKGVKSQTEDSVIEVKKLPTWRHEGVWASHSWSSHVAEDTRFVSDWERGNLVSLAYLREGKGFQILGAQLDFGYENPINTSAIVQWGPRMKESAIAFAFLAGIAGYRDSDSDLVQNSNRPTQLTPLVGGSLKFYPLDRASIDFAGSINLRSTNGAGDRESDFTRTLLHHYEMGIRLYISPTLNLKAGYGKWRLGEYDNTSVQVGLGATF